MNNGRLNHRKIIFTALNNSAFDTIEEKTAFTINQSIDLYEFMTKQPLRLYQIDLPLLVNELQLNVKKFVDQIYQYGFDIVPMRGTLRNSLFLQRIPMQKQNA